MFEGSFLKLERANEHIFNLEDAFRGFAESHPYSAIINTETQDGKILGHCLSIDFGTPLPSALSLILGDATHNLRCALDHAVWELFGIDGGAQDRWTKLPTGDTRVNFESSAQGMKTPRQDTKDFLINLAIYPTGGGEPLYGLHLLDNVDKHTVIVPVAHASAASGVVFVEPGTGQRFKADTIYADPTSDRFQTLVTALPGWQIDANHKIELTPEIFFGEVDIFPFEPIFPTLLFLADAVSDTLGEFRNFVQSRP